MPRPRTITDPTFFNAYIPRTLAEAVDRQRGKMNRSEFLRNALIAALEAQGKAQGKKNPQARASTQQGKV